MVQYEVNLEIDPSIYNQFLEFIPQHIQEILALPGFLKARLFKPLQPESPYSICIYYELDTVESLENYLINFASTMRHKTQVLFGDKLNISRRTMQVLQVF